jgi:hypothetical protein
MNVMFIECVWGDMDLFQNLPQMGVRDPPWEEFEAEFADEKRKHLTPDRRAATCWRSQASG